MKFQFHANYGCEKKICFFLIFLIFAIYFHKKSKKIKVGIFGCRHDYNVGNFLVKYSLYIKLFELGYQPYIVTTNHKNVNISFLNQTTDIVIIKDYSELKESDYDILIVNSDQTWRKWDKYFYDCGFLKFAQNWNKLKFVYGASLGFDYWNFNKEDEEIIAKLIKKFSQISVREKGSIQLIQKHFGIKPRLVLDPTLIIDKKYYLKLIKDYRSDMNEKANYIFVYKVSYSSKAMIKFIKKAREILNYSIYDYHINNKSLIEDFIYHIKNSKAVITNSFHCTIFSIIFRKPFITFNFKSNGFERIKSLSELLGFKNRIVDNNKNIPKISLLTTIPKIDYKILNKKRDESLDYISSNLHLFK
jgi:polysaccharide pyruvyl transferase WcaK-like protein